MNPLNESGSYNFKNNGILSNDIIHILFDNVTIQTRSKGKKCTWCNIKLMFTLNKLKAVTKIITAYACIYMVVGIANFVKYCK